MKTQISSLINGAANVIRDETHAKYAAIPKDILYIGCSGTNNKVREKVAARVREENGDTLHISVRGIELTLQIHYSKTGKTWWYESELTEEQYTQICKTSLGVGANISKYSITITMLGTVEIRSFHAQNEKQTLKQGYSPCLDEAFITIL